MLPTNKARRVTKLLYPVFVLLGALCLSRPAAAEDWPSATAEEAHQKQQLRRVIIDNDEFVGLNVRDRWYSSGVRIEFGGLNAGPAPAPLMRWLCPLSAAPASPASPAAAAAQTHTSSWSLGQEIFTQDRRDRVDANPDDRPIAAYLYGEYASGQFGPNRDSATAVAIGVTGPSALGEPLQNGLHRVLGVQQVPNWHQQLRPRLAITARTRCLGRWPIHRHPAAPIVTAGYGMRLGSLSTEASAVLAIAFGPAAPSLRPPVQARDAMPTPPGEGAWGLMIGLRVRGVAYDALIDGSAYGYQSRSKHRAWVGEAFVEIEARITAHWRISYGIVRRTHEFDSPTYDGRFSPQTFGQITLRRDWPL